VQRDVFRAIVGKLMDERLARGINTAHGEGSRYEPELYLIFSSEQEPTLLDTVPDTMWGLSPPPVIVDLLAQFFEEYLAEVKPPKDYYAVAMISEAWQRVGVDTGDMRDHLQKMLRERRLGEDPESYTVVIGCAYTPVDKHCLFLTTEDPGIPFEDAELGDEVRGAIPDAVRRLGNALLGPEREGVVS
jgi:hypothetical protein